MMHAIEALVYSRRSAATAHGRYGPPIRRRYDAARPAAAYFFSMILLVYMPPIIALFPGARIMLSGWR